LQCAGLLARPAPKAKRGPPEHEASRSLKPAPSFLWQLLQARGLAVGLVQWDSMLPCCGGRGMAARAPHRACPARVLAGPGFSAGGSLCLLPLWFYILQPCSPAVLTHTWYSASRLPEVRGRACAQAAGASYASYRSDSLYNNLNPFQRPTAPADHSSAIWVVGYRQRSIPTIRTT
jgi:hypothetical protein